MKNTNDKAITEQMLTAFHEMTDYCSENGIYEFVQLEQIADTIPEWYLAIENKELRKALFTYIEKNTRNTNESNNNHNKRNEQTTEDIEDIPFY